MKFRFTLSSFGKKTHVTMRAMNELLATKNLQQSHISIANAVVVVS